MLHRRPFVKAVESELRADCGVEPGQRLLVAVSGGADSVALAVALAVLAARRQWALDVHLAHINHHLRDAADDDEQLVRKLADTLDVSFHRADIQPADLPGNLEANARDERYAALLTIADDIEADAIATAHHGDDQLESMLMRLIRGASVHGMVGIHSRRRLADRHVLIRPMLGVDHAAAVEFLKTIEQPWREDETNRDRTRWRAKLRADVLPVLRELRPDAAAKAVDTARRLRDAARIVNRTVRRAEARHVEHDADGTMTLPREAARRMPPALLSELIRRLCLRAGCGADQLASAVIEPVVRAAHDDRGEPRRFEMPDRVVITIDGERIRWKRTAQRI